ncbi:transmembrane protein 42 [Trichonephila clavata]|uniref:Transmembrane protein 42 n=1 Tax=Trichonephila clavata TaxID=2740835 RepID=A0A8X6FEJ5_TRICU|nr:transmembrane protein 42 [Trichonephila clavata]
MKGITFSLLSGFLAATASLCGKFSMAAEKALMFCETFMENLPSADNKKTSFSVTPVCQNVLFITRVGFFLAMLLSNALMWTFFTKALRLSATTLEATITNTAANFLFTAVYGQVFFGETVTFLWWLGTTLIITGLTLMHKADEEEPPPVEREENNSSDKVKSE